MKIKLILLLAFLASGSQIVQAKPTSLDKDGLDQPETSSTTINFFKQSAAELIYGYMNFHFNSASDGNYSSYIGHSNLYAAGADRFKIAPNIIAGVYYFKVDTSLNSSIFLNPSPLATAYQLVNNNTVFGHVLGNITPAFALDFAGGYGDNRISSVSTVLINTPNQGIGYSLYNNDNWFLSANAVYTQAWGHYLFRGTVGSLYSEIDTGNYILSLTNSYPTIQTVQLTPQLVAPLTTKTTYLIETGELNYTLWPQVTPFVNAALLQVVQFSNSRPLVATQINGTLPELNINQNGFRVGGGFTFMYKQLKLRVEEKYFNAGNLFTSTQTLVGLEYQFS